MRMLIVNIGPCSRPTATALVVLTITKLHDASSTRLSEKHEAGCDVMSPAEAPGTGLLVELAAVGPGEPLAAVLAAEQPWSPARHVQHVPANAAISEIN